ncbi:LapA family protein [bacterium]|nr:MAG: LapA family protein [bacterium]
MPRRARPPTTANDNRLSSPRCKGVGRLPTRERECMGILALLILAFLVVVVLVNLLTGAQANSVSLILWSWSTVPLGYVIALSAVAGAVIVWLAGMPKHVARFWTIRRLESMLAERQRAYEALAKETASLRPAGGAPPPAVAKAEQTPAPVHGEYQPPPAKS